MLSIKLRKKQGSLNIDFSVEINGAGITALHGPSGAGKTSVINMIAGLVQPDSGSITVNDRKYFDASMGINLPPEQRRCGYVFQESRLFPHLSVKSNLLYGWRLKRPEQRFVHPDKVIELLDIKGLLNRRPAKLSGGEKQRVAIGRALLAAPEVMLMDEPLASLDGALKAEILPFIAQLPGRFSVPVIYVSHSAEEIAGLADNVVLMDSGCNMELLTREDFLKLLPSRSGFAMRSICQTDQL